MVTEANEEGRIGQREEQGQVRVPLEQFGEITRPAEPLQAVLRPPAPLPKGMTLCLWPVGCHPCVWPDLRCISVCSPWPRGLPPPCLVTLVEWRWRLRVILLAQFPSGLALWKWESGTDGKSTGSRLPPPPPPSQDVYTPTVEECIQLQN